MKRLLPLFTISLLALLIALPSGAVRAENSGWNDVAKEFKNTFKTKNPLKERRRAVKTISKSKDGRGVKELLKAVKTQGKFTKKLRKEWEREEEAWTEKTEKLEEQVDRKREQSSDGSITVTEEEDAWLGLTEKYQQRGGPRPKMHIEKDRIQKLYKTVLEEEDFTPYVFKSISRLINTLEGTEHERAVSAAAGEAKRAKPEKRGAYLQMFAYMTSEDATDTLVGFTKETDPGIVMLALEALGRQNSEKGMNVLIERLEDPRWQIRASAIKGLSYYHDTRAVEALISAAKKEEGVLRRKYFAALARIVQEQIPGTVEAWDSFWSENKEDFADRWKRLPKNEPVEGEPPDIPIDTNLGSTSFYGIRTNSKHIIFVVDISGSMGEGGGKNEQGEMRIDVARKELRKAIQSLTAKDEDDRGAASFNVVIFASTVDVYKPGKMVKATKSAKEKAYKWIDEAIQATTFTNIYDAVERAFNVISEKKEGKNLAKGADTIFLMTDGGPNRGKFTDEELILRGIQELNKTRKLTIHTIGVGQGHNGAFLQRMAAQNDGQYLSR